MKLESKTVALAGLSFVSGFFFCAIVLSSSRHAKPAPKVHLEGPALASAAPAAKVTNSVPLFAGFRVQEPVTFRAAVPLEGQVRSVPPEEEVWNMSRKPAWNTYLIDFRVQSVGF
jgi:hypothetical protein